jgi:hypothetical protein
MERTFLLHEGTLLAAVELPQIGHRGVTAAPHAAVLV